MASVGKRGLACIALAGLVPFGSIARAATPATAFVVAQAAPPAVVAPATYTPIRRPAASPVPASAQPVIPPRPTPPALPSPATAPPSALPAPAYQPAVPRAPAMQYQPPMPYQPPPTPSYAPVPWNQPPVPPPTVAAPRTDVPPSATTATLATPSSRAAEPAAVATAHAISPSKPSRHYFGVGTDVGMPDGWTLGLVLMPADWLRIGAALGTTSLSDPELVGLYRGSLSFVPLGWGPSFNFDAGHRNVAPTTWLLRTFFSVPSWVNPYVQELGYTYFNAHVGFDYTVWGFTLYLHGGGTYLLGTVRAPKSVVVDSKTNTSINIAQDGEFRAFTLSAKAGIIYHFGGGG